MSHDTTSSEADVMTVPVRHGMFCWFEHHSDAPERAIDYWTALVGGESMAVPLPCGNTMHLMNSGQHHRWSLRALAGCPALLIERGPHWLPFVAVDDTDAAYVRAMERGARSIAAPNENGMGRGAMIEDPHGAAIGLFTAAPGATDGVNPHGHGFMCWCELVTPDPKASAAFLADVLGWTSTEQDMGDFTVTIASAGGHPVASLWKQCADDAHPWKRARWYPYVQVNEMDSAAAQAKALGATLPCDVMPIPGVGRWQPTYDPTGCETALLEPAPRAPKEV
jgi:predicted enzyme related to lactoylglutathione lyase